MTVEPPRPVQIHMLSSLPPPYGGVNIWTQWFLAQAPRYAMTVRLDAIGAKSVADTLRWSSRLGRLMRGFVKPLWSMTLGQSRHADVLHVCASGGASFWRGLLLCALRLRQNGRCVLHLHSRATSCSPRALRAARRLARQPRMRVVSPSTEDGATHPFLHSIDHFVPTDFGAGCTWRGPTAGPLRLVYIGWMIREKGLFELVTALGQIRDVTVDAFGPNVRPGDLTALEALAQSLHVAERFRYRGLLAHDDVAATTCAYDALILPSYGESFGFAAAEAMHLGIPVIAPRVGFLWDAPDTAFVPLARVEPTQLVATLQGLRDDKRGRLQDVAVAGRAYVAERFDPARVMSAWAALYGALLASPTGGSESPV